MRIQISSIYNQKTASLMNQYVTVEELALAVDRALGYKRRTTGHPAILAAPVNLNGAKLSTLQLANKLTFILDQLSLYWTVDVTPKQSNLLEVHTPGEYGFHVSDR